MGDNVSHCIQSEIDPSTEEKRHDRSLTMLLDMNENQKDVICDMFR